MATSGSVTHQKGRLQSSLLPPSLSLSGGGVGGAAVRADRHSLLQNVPLLQSRCHGQPDGPVPAHVGGPWVQRGPAGQPRLVESCGWGLLAV